MANTSSAELWDKHLILALDAFPVANYACDVNWSSIIADLRERGYTLQQIKDAAGFASRGHVHDVANERKTNIGYELGARLMALHRRAMRRKT